jgi:hypothetical protein
MRVPVSVLTFCQMKQLGPLWRLRIGPTYHGGVLPNLHINAEYLCHVSLVDKGAYKLK